MLPAGAAVELLASIGRHAEARSRAEQTLSIIDGPAARDAGAIPERIRHRLRDAGPQASISG